MARLGRWGVAVAGDQFAVVVDGFLGGGQGFGAAARSRGEEAAEVDERPMARSGR
jgi:hypothetical protein